MTDFTALKNTLSALTVEETGRLVPMLEEAWGVKAPRGAMGETPGVATPDVVEVVQTDFTVELTSVDPLKKIAVIQVVRKLTGMGLKESKAIVDAAPASVFGDVVDKAKAEAAQAELQVAGGVVTLK